ncbi:MAG: T9SS type A sorting domain-containing protein [Bacteroidetes bacterium]|nr:T9SS type A sorting domain-containing protein [Bacteroidota bacterium]
MKVNNYIVRTCSAVFLLFLGVNGISQTGAAGVGSSATNVIWLDANTLNLSNGNSVSSFTDVSGNSNNFTQALSTKQPIFTTGAVNGLPALSYDGVDDVLNSGSIAALESANLTYFIVFRRSSLKLQYIIGANYASSDKKWVNYTNSANNLLISAHYSPTIKYTSFNEPGGAFTFTSSHITPTSISQRRQGTLMGTTTGAYTVPTGHNKVTLGNVPFTTWQNCALSGYIAEVVIYNSALNNLERILVENYLGAKYNMAVPTDLYAYQATHNIGLIAVGNNGTNSQTIAEGAGILEISNPVSMTSNEYLLIAHTNDALSSFTTSGMPGSLPNHERWLRTWRADETGDVGTTTLTYDLNGGNDFGASASYLLLVDNVTQDGDFSDAAQIAGTYSAGSISFDVDLAAGDYFTLAAIPQVLEIHSITSGPWSAPGTWDCTCIPSFVDQVYIDPTHAVTVDIDAETNYLNVDITASVVMSSAVTLSIYGDVDWFGSTSITDGTIAFVGTADQYIDAGVGNSIEFNDLEINNSSGLGVTFYESEYVISGTLYPTLGTLTIDPAPGNSFIINSTSDVGGGRIAAINGGAAITGNVTVRRFIPAGVADYRDIASPVIGATLTQWDDDLFISGVGFPDGCAYGTGGCFYSVKKYVINQYVDQTSMANPLTNGVGFEAYMGDDTIVFSGTTLDVTGTVRDGSDFPVTVGNEWQIQGNPFASPISFSTVTRSHVGNFFYVYDAATGFYEYWDGSDNSSSVPELANGLIATGQGFWTYDWGTLTYKETDKVSSATYVKAANNSNPLMVSLRENISTYRSSISLVEDAAATDDIDTVMDIRHLSTGQEKAPTVAFYSSEELIRKNYIRHDGRNKSFELYTKIINPGYHTFEALNIETFDTYRKVLLFDNVTGEFIDLKRELAYTFYSDAFEGHRFTLILTSEDVQEGSTIQSLTVNETAIETESMTITQMGNSFNVNVTEAFNEDSQIRLVNVLGQTDVYSGQIRFVEGSNMISVPAELKGVHILIITTGDKIVTKKVVL